ncbi:hypothetical protein DMH04_23860 [Kibdelosporangium aridum]|uniref:Ricin B lectin domain-containing protein n=1 Tax=Kibdelosporangium aridum TaxID=2030 RepID=A0A428Z728_KIBAR|nr:RICIN domain-containing protein [Kibdelosporangium aridum]RSM83176.1 hypothetical protein DMH04_23860 [Kibdelosporangium aridum]
MTGRARRILTRAPLGAVCALLAGGITAFASPAASAAEVRAGAAEAAAFAVPPHRIINRNSYKCLDVKYDDTGVAAIHPVKTYVVQRRCDHRRYSQIWTGDYYGGNEYLVRHGYSDKCLDVTGAYDAYLVLHYCDHYRVTQRWHITGVGNGDHVFYNPATDMCMGVYHSDRKDGAYVVTEYCDKYKKNQRWFAGRA